MSDHLAYSEGESGPASGNPQEAGDAGKEPRHPATLEARPDKDGMLLVTVGGVWMLETGSPDPGKMLAMLEDDRVKGVVARARDLGRWDSSLIAVTAQLAASAKQRGISCDLQNLPEGVRNLTQLALAVPPNKDARRKATDERWLARIGAFALKLPAAVDSVLDFLGEIILSFGRLFGFRAATTSRNVWLCVQEAGVDSLPIVSLISMLVGLILAFVGMVQLSMFGAEIYISSLVAIGMTRIMGAIMTGIILAGRIGASYAAVIGTMQVNEEIDALKTTGIPPSDFLVLPRLIALSLMTPLLVLYSDFMGMLGGFLVGVVMLGLDPMEYLSFTQKGFGLSNLWVGVTHGFVFGVVVAVTGCYQGLNCGRNAAAVGVATTAAVVYSIVGIVISTAILTVLFNILGI